ncbi:Sodium/hydrogen exchanger family-domain-containing protein [Syncephalastrum racemosum]|uniref:Sodium/hydrogen exchanger family-domain-containing protein n=1 Tax=Syncephalastrum racemosum TaxID=13706 RepID=A0A1X2HIC8_SYNRA|nr:Sodium/hydrogen exchanger family-domain-containing protein [Syncephalastrum racemosum]
MTVELIPGEFSPFTIAVAILSGFIVIFGFVSMFVKEKLFLSEAFVALIVGIIAGPLVSNGFNPYEWDGTDEFTKEITRCIIAIQVMAVGIDLPKHYMKKEWLTMFMLLIPVMIFMWLVSGLFIWGLVPPINYLEALVIAACVCPTDPILANSVVKGRFAEKHVPAHIRNALSAESGANDGMGFPFMFLAIFLIGEEGTGHAIGKWIYETCLFQIALSVVIGIVVGYVARKLLQWSEKRHLIDKPSFLCFAIALALFLMSMTGFSGSDDVLACFAAGNAFSWDDWFRQETEEAHFQEVIDMMLNLAVFVYIGAIIPWHEFGNAALGLSPWRLVVIAILILLFRRLPIVIALKPVMPALKTYREAIFSGWFGPMGVGAVFLSMIAKENLEKVFEHSAEKPVVIEVISPVVLFIVLASTLVHGTTIPLFQLGKRIRTRTLSVTSTGSSHVMRLPKINFGQQLNLKRRSQQQQDSGDLADQMMSETQRNTLINTIQRKKEAEAAAAAAAGRMGEGGYAIDMDDDAEEDFLPGESDDEMQDHDQHKPSAAELQSIRFLEPTKPSAHNIEKNEASVSSFRNWLGRNQDTTHSQSSATGSMNNSNNDPKESSNNNSSGGSALRNLFRRNNNNNANSGGAQDVPHSEKEAEQVADMPQTSEGEAERAEEAYHEQAGMPRIEVWEEHSHVVIEDTEDIAPQVVLDKNDPNWKTQMKEAVEDIKKTVVEQKRKDEGGSDHH